MTAGLGLRLAKHVENFRQRVLADALAEATAAYWLRRAHALEAARPQRRDFSGRATAAELREQDRRLEEAARACRNRARVSILGGDL